jgi:2-hydroxy-3-keto-5-methylthiopentenyl-1-phosphate phosphatase
LFELLEDLVAESSLREGFGASNWVKEDEIQVVVVVVGLLKTVTITV